MAEKNSFILRTGYKEIFSEMSDKQAGALIKAIFDYVAAKETPAGLNDVEVKMAFKFIKQDIDYDTAKYADLCERRSEWGKKGAKARTETASISQHKPKTENSASISQHIDSDGDSDSEGDVVSDGDSDIYISAACAAETKKSSFSAQKNDIAEFADIVMKNFEHLETDNQRRIWLSNNRAYLKKILDFCEGDKDIALQCIAVCVQHLEKAGYEGGYNAVCRNIQSYYQKARQQVLAWRKDNGKQE